MEIFERLAKVQQDVKAPKGNYNNYGQYRYRSCEDILAAVKPVLAKHGGTIVLCDEIVEIGGRIYVKATATYVCEEGRVDTYGYARESQAKKGMDESQITGTASSYARKYALNGLLLLDDTKDADTNEFHEQTTEQKREKLIDNETASTIAKLAGYAKVNLTKALNGRELMSISMSEAERLLKALKEKADEVQNGIQSEAGEHNQEPKI